MLLRTVTKRRLLTSGVAAALAGLLTGCSALESLGGSPDDAPRDDSGAVTAPATAAPASAKVGDCLGKIPDGTFTTLPIVPCDEKHRGEIFAEKKLPDGRYPGEKKVVAQTDTFCETEFATFVGLPFDESELYFVSFYPTKGSWAQQDRTIQCVLDSEKPVTGTLEHSKR